MNGLNELTRLGCCSPLYYIKDRPLQWDLSIQTGDSSLVHRKGAEDQGWPAPTVPKKYIWAVREPNTPSYVVGENRSTHSIPGHLPNLYVNHSEITMERASNRHDILYHELAPTQRL
jgi:hypothetical protein